MEANSIAIRHWDDVVFENRNKLYGAYLLRKAYANHLLAGVGVTVAMLTLLLALPEIFPPEKVIREPYAINDHDFGPMPPPVIDLIRVPEKPIVQSKSVVPNSPVLVTRDVVDEKAIESVRSYGDNDNDNTGVIGEIGTVEGFGTTLAVVPQPVVEPVVRDFAEVMPQYEGGLEAMMRFIQKKIRYPRVPRQQGIAGTVYVRFVVNGDGSIGDVTILKGVHPDYDREAVRVISILPAWKGGTHNGTPVPVRMVLPIKFHLNK